MLSCLVCAGVAVSIFDLVAPIVTTRPGSVGYWSLIGAATNMRSSVRFISNATSQMSNGMCHGKGIDAERWTLEMRVKVTSGMLGVRFARHAYTLVGDQVGVVMARDGRRVDVRDFQRSDVAVCGYDFEDEFELRLERNGFGVDVMVRGNESEYRLCTSLAIDFQPVYLVVEASAKVGIGDAEVLSVRASDPDGQLEKVSADGLEMESYEEDRETTLKHVMAALRDSEMWSLGHAKEPNQGETTAELRAIVPEILERTRSFLPNDKLEKLVLGIVIEGVSNVEAVMHQRRQELVNITEELDAVKSDVDKQVKWLCQYALDSMTEAKKDAVEKLAAFLEYTKNTKSLKQEAKARAREARETAIPTLLYIVAFVELVCYLAFFVTQHKKTHGFKKYD